MGTYRAFIGHSSALQGCCFLQVTEEKVETQRDRASPGLWAEVSSASFSGHGVTGSELMLISQLNDFNKSPKPCALQSECFTAVVPIL